MYHCNHITLKINHMKKLLLSILLFSTVAVNAQTNVVKWNLMGLFLGNVSLQYERTLNEHSAVALGFGFLPSRGLPTIITDEDSTGDLKLLSISGFSITPEYRYYFSGKAPKGFYMAPYIRYSKYSIDKLGVSYNSSTTGLDERIFVDGSFKATTLGLMFGSQWLLGEHMTLDWWILGVGFGSQKATIAGTGNFDASEINDIKSDLADMDEDFPGELEYTVSSNSVSVAYKYGAPAIRGFGLCLGYKF